METWADIKNPKIKSNFPKSNYEEFISKLLLEKYWTTDVMKVDIDCSKEIKLEDLDLTVPRGPN